MLTCPYCSKEMRNAAGMSMHFRRHHPARWKKTLKASLPPGFNLGIPEKRRKFKAVNKSKLPPLLVLDEAPRKAGRQPIDLSLLDPDKARQLRLKRAYNAKLRKRNIAKGLTSSGQPRKREAYPRKQPAIIEAKIVKKEVLLTQGRMFINRCPDCGKRLDPHYVAAGISAKMDYEEAKTKVNLYEANQNQ